MDAASSVMNAIESLSGVMRFELEKYAAERVGNVPISKIQPNELAIIIRDFLVEYPDNSAGS